MTKGSEGMAANDSAKGGREPPPREWIRPRGETWFRRAPPSSGEGELPGAAPRHRLIAAGRVANAAVFDRSGRRVGRIAEIAIDDATAEVVFVLVAEGGILGFGGRLRRTPWSSLSYDVTRGGYVLGAASEAPVSGKIAFQSAADRGGWATRG